MSDTTTNDRAKKSLLRRDVANALDELRPSFGDRIQTGAAVCEHHANAMTWTKREPPDAVIFPESTADVVRIVQACAKYRVPMIPFGAGSSFEGQLNAPFGGLSIDTRMMNRILAVHPEDLDCVVEAGVTRLQLNEHLKTEGLFFPIDPGADASIGGMTSTRASGTNAVRYGTMKDNVISLTVVLPDGQIMKTASRARKSSTGYDLTKLFVGAEGTLGIVTEITLKLHGIPEAISAGVCPFPTVDDACNAAIQTMQIGIPVARIELLDDMQVKACNLHSKLTLPEVPMLFVEFHGSDSSVKEQAERFGEIAAALGGGPFEWATKPEDRSRLWHARHQAFWASMSLRPGSTNIATDVCVPISRLAECVMATKEDITRMGLIATIVGHVGDGNFHVHPVFNLQDPKEVATVREFVDRLVDRAIAMEGTCSGEHGIGQEKIKYMHLEHDSAALSSLAFIKKAFDPQNIMNRGKMLP